MKRVPLTQGKWAVVDDADYDLLSQFKWSYDSNGYARRATQLNNKQTKIYLHRFLMDCPKGSEVDHINRDKLDNRRKNLRVCSRQINAINKSKQSNNKSGYIGVSWHNQVKKWRAYSGRRGEVKHLGLFDSAEEAAVVRDRYAVETFGKYAKLNFRST